jgi:hypothetical protein
MLRAYSRDDYGQRATCGLRYLGIINIVTITASNFYYSAKHRATDEISEESSVSVNARSEPQLT